MQAIVISGSPEMGSNDQPDLENATFMEAREASPPPRSDPSDPPPKQAPGRP